MATRIGIMAFGRLRAVGSQVHLKHKYGTGFKLTISLKPESEDAAADSGDDEGNASGGAGAGAGAGATAGAAASMTTDVSVEVVPIPGGEKGNSTGTAKVPGGVAGLGGGKLSTFAGGRDVSVASSGPINEVATFVKAAICADAELLSTVGGTLEYGRQLIDAAAMMYLFTSSLGGWRCGAAAGSCCLEGRSQCRMCFRWVAKCV